MKTDWSKLFYDRYSKTDHATATVTMRDGRVITGSLVSYALGEITLGDSYITRWQIVPEKDKMTTGRDAFGFLIGEYVYQKDILRILLHDDQTEFHFC